MVSTEKSRGSRIPPAGSDANRDWTRTLGESASNLERGLGKIIRERPLVAVGGAVALGWASFFLTRRKRFAPSRRGRSALADTLAPTFARFRGGFARAGGADSPRQNFVSLVESELEERPWQTLAAAAALGFGLGNVDRDSVKRGVLRVARLVAEKSLGETGAGGGSSASSSQMPETTHDPEEGVSYDYDRKYAH